MKIYYKDFNSCCAVANKLFFLCLYIWTSVPGSTQRYNFIRLKFIKDQVTTVLQWLLNINVLSSSNTIILCYASIYSYNSWEGVNLKKICLLSSWTGSFIFFFPFHFKKKQLNKDTCIHFLGKSNHSFCSQRCYELFKNTLSLIRCWHSLGM